MRVGTDRWQRLGGFRWSRTTTYARFTEERLVVCEVKTRSGTGYGEPSDGVTPAKVAGRLCDSWSPSVRQRLGAWRHDGRAAGACSVALAEDTRAALMPMGRPAPARAASGLTSRVSPVQPPGAVPCQPSQPRSATPPGSSMPPLARAGEPV
jgi:hypothetical protein